MSVIDNAFNNDDTRVQRFLRTAAHWMPYAVALQAALIVLHHLGVTHWLLLTGQWIVTIVFFVGVFHNLLARLCVRCMEEVPADAGQRAERKRWALRIAHALDTPRKLLMYLAGFTTVIVLASLDFPRLVSLPLDLFVVAFMYGTWLHHRLRPWCPYCRPWDDGGGIQEPSPDPVETATR